MTTIVMYQNCLAADKQHSDSISRSSYLATKLSVSSSGCLAVSIAGDTKPVASLLEIADVLEELIRQDRECETSTLLNRIWDKLMLSYLNRYDSIYFMYKYDGAIYMTYVRYELKMSECKITSVVPPMVSTYGTGAHIAEFLAGEQVSRGELDIDKIYRWVGHQDPCSSEAHDTIYGETLCDLKHYKGKKK